MNLDFDMAGIFGFDLLPALCEGDEHISLSDILASRDEGLSDEELWAVTRECCLALQSVYNSSEMFQYLCIMPETLAFDSSGAICFLDTVTNPDPMYIPPEYVTVGNSFKAHLFSLGMTMLYAAEYNAPLDKKRELGTDLDSTLHQMTADEYDHRISPEQVLAQCESALKETDSAQVCLKLAISGRSNLSYEEEKMEKIDEVDEEFLRDSPMRVESEYMFTTSNLIGLDDEPRAMSSPKTISEKKCHQNPRIHLTSGHNNQAPLDTYYFIDKDSEEVFERKHLDISGIPPGFFQDLDGLNSMDGSPDLSSLTSARINNNISPIEGDFHVDLVNLDAKESPKGSEQSSHREAAYLSDKHKTIASHSSDDDSEKGTESNALAITSGDHLPPEARDVRSGGLNSPTPTPQHNGDSLPHSTDHSEPVTSCTEPSTSTPTRQDTCDSSQQNVLTPDFSHLTKDLKDAFDKSEISANSDVEALKDTGAEGSQELPIISGEINSKSIMDNNKAQSIHEILEKLGCGLHEGELWSLCRECVIALHRDAVELPAYISPETVYVEEEGSVSYYQSSEDHELDVVYLAPELQQFGVVTEKSCLFGIAAMLWSAADYKMPPNQEPALSEQFENHLVSMTQENTELRPTMSDVLQACNIYHNEHGLSSAVVCQTLGADAQKAHHFNGKNNALVRDLIDEGIEQKVQDYKAKILEDIRQAQVQLKPASERQLAQRKIEFTLHDRLMKEILRPSQKLRKTAQPKEMTVKQIFDLHPDFMQDLLIVTGKAARVRQLSILSQSEGERKAADSDTNVSAFSSIGSKRELSSGSNRDGEPVVPEAFRSTATHFTPIVVTDDVQASVIKKEKPRTRQLPKPNKEIDVAKKIKELKKNLMKNRAPLNLAQDLENDLLKEEERQTQKVRTARPKSEEKPRDGRPTSGENRPKSEDANPRSGEKRQQSDDSRPKSGDLRRSSSSRSSQPRTPPPLAPSEQHVLKIAKGDFERYHQFGTDTEYITEDEHTIKASISKNQNISEPQMQNAQNVNLNIPMNQNQPQMHPQLAQGPASQPYPVSAPQGGPVTGPNQAHSTAVPGQLMGYPYSMGAMFPLQVQLQHDPQTGLFNVIPVPATAVTSPTGANISQGPTSQPFFIPPGMTGGPLSTNSVNAVPSQQPVPVTPPYKEEMERVAPHKPPRQSVKENRELLHFQAPRHRSGSFDSGEDDSNGVQRSQSESKTRSRPNKEINRSRSHTVPSTNAGTRHNLEELHKSRDSAHKNDSTSRQRHSKSGLFRSNSAERLDRIEEIPKVKPKKLRELKQKSKIRRAKSGSSLDFKNSMKELRELQVYDDSMYFNHHHSGDNLPHSNGLSKSQPSLNDNPAGGGHSAHERRRRRRATTSMSPDDGSPSPPLSPSWSKDSGVSGLNLKGTGDLTLMERLLSSDTIKHQQKLSKVIRLLREEFAFDGYMENGIEDLAMAEYILSLANLKWDTFGCAVTEKYCDLYWQEDLLLALYEAVNGQKPFVKRRVNQGKELVQQASKPPLSESSVHNAGSPREVAPRDCYDGSAFRPIEASSGSRSLNSGGPVVKPKAVKLTSSEDTDSNSASTVRVKKTKPPRKRVLDKHKSSSMHNLTESSSQDEGPSVMKAKSDKDLTKSTELSCALTAIEINGLTSVKYSASFSAPKPRVIYVQSNSVIESKSNNNSPISPIVEDPFAMPSPENTPVTSQSCMQLNRHDSDPNSTLGTKWESLRVDSDKPRGLRVVRTQSCLRKGSVSSESSIQSAQQVRKVLNLAHSTSHLNESSDTPSATELQQKSNKEEEAKSSGTGEWIHRGAVVYYHAEMEGNLRTDVKDFASQMNSQTKETIDAKMREIKQNITMEEKNKKKTFRYYSRLIETTKSGKVSADHKNKLVAVSKQLAEANDRLKFLDAAHKHLEMLHAEQWGIDHDLLYALANCPGDQPMLLSACDNSLVQYQPIRNPRTGMNAQALQAGTPLGLCTYLFAQHALSDGYIHQFFYCFRYFITPSELLHFLCTKFMAATLSLSPDAQVPVKVKARSLDLIQVWMEGYFSVDFRFNTELQNDLRNFIRDKVIPEDSGYKHLLELLECCQEGYIAELAYKDFVSVNTSLDEDSDSAKKCGSQREVETEWESMKAALHLSAKPQKLQMSRPAGCLETRRNASETVDTYHPKTGPRRTDSFTLADYTPQMLAEQLTLMEQELFQEVHPIHYLNSRAQGISVALAHPIMNKAQSLNSINSAWEDHHSSSLFVGSHVMDDTIQRVIEHGQGISFWVAAEILSCNSSKAQIGVLAKFIYTAKACQELRNFATCMAIVDGLENIIIRQLPVWKNIPSKCAAILDDLSNTKMQLKSDSMWLVTKESQPTIPCTFLFLLHVQQQEIGGFKLANGMFKWQKIRALCKLIDQIRVNKLRRYSFLADHELHTSIQQRLQDFGQQDLHSLASQHATNFQKVSRKGSIFRRMTGKFQRKSDV